MKTIKKYCQLMILIIAYAPYLAYAEADPFSKAGNGISKILFGSLGMTLCSIIIGVTFLMAKLGKVTWDKFISIAMCTAGFIGAPAIVSLFQTWVGN